MAQLYTCIYTYVGQGDWTSADRQVPLSSFTVSGDTDRTKAQIVSIEYQYHANSKNYLDWPLKGGLALSDGRVLYSDTVTKNIEAGHSVSCENSFGEISGEDFAKVEYVRTYAKFVGYGDNAASTEFYYTKEDPTGDGDGKLTWCATSKYPMRLIVKFYEEPPLIYYPTIEKFNVVRGTYGGTDMSQGTERDDGGSALFTMKLSAASSISEASNVAIELLYSEGTASTSMTPIKTWTSFGGTDEDSFSANGYSNITFEALHPVIDDETGEVAALSTDKDYRFVLRFVCSDPERTETAIATFDLSNTFVALHIAPYKTGGVAIGDLSTASEGHPKFEVKHKSYFNDEVYFNKPVHFASNQYVHGHIDVASIKDNTVTKYIVTFGDNVKFTTPPEVVAGLTSDGTDFTSGYFGQVAVYVKNVTVSGFDLLLCANHEKDSNQRIGINWIAIGGTSSGSSSGGSSNEGDSDSGNEGSGGTGSGTVGSVAIKSLSFSGGVLTPIMTDGTTGTTVTIFKYGTSLPSASESKAGDLFFLV